MNVGVQLLSKAAPAGSNRRDQAPVDEPSGLTEEETSDR
jgi:hypothetical protein